MQNTLKKTLIHAFLTISGIYITHIGKEWGLHEQLV